MLEALQLIGALALMVGAARLWQAWRTRRAFGRARPGECADWRTHGVLWRYRVVRGGGGAGAADGAEVEVDGPLCPRPGCGARLFEIGGKVLECPDDESRYAKPPLGRTWLDLRERVRRDAARYYARAGRRDTKAATPAAGRPGS